MKINENQKKIMKIYQIYENLWILMKINENPWKPMKTQWKHMKTNKIQRKSIWKWLKINENQWNSKIYENQCSVAKHSPPSYYCQGGCAWKLIFQRWMVNSIFRAAVARRTRRHGISSLYSFFISTLNNPTNIILAYTLSCWRRANQFNETQIWKTIDILDNI